MKNGSRGFTLIELMVVISIIALLSSVVLAALSGARDKGRIAGIEIFVGNVYQTHGIDAIAYWNFNEGTQPLSKGSGDGLQPALDLSGHNRTLLAAGSAGNGVNRENATTPVGSGSALSFTKNSGWAQITHMTGADLQQPSGLTVSLWIDFTALTNSTGNIMYIGSAGEERNSDLWLTVTQNGSNSGYNCSSGGMNFANVSFSALDTGKWHNITCTESLDKSGNGTMTAYYDGKSVGKDTQSYSEIGPIDEIGIGNGPYGIEGESGNDNLYSENIDDVAIYGSALTANQIHEIYAREAPQHQYAAK